MPATKSYTYEVKKSYYYDEDFDKFRVDGASAESDNMESKSNETKVDYSLKLLRISDSEVDVTLTTNCDWDKTVIGTTVTNSLVKDIPLKRLANKIMENISPENDRSPIKEIVNLTGSKNGLNDYCFVPIVEKNTIEKDLEKLTAAELKKHVEHIDSKRMVVDGALECYEGEKKQSWKYLILAVDKTFESERRRIWAKERRMERNCGLMRFQPVGLLDAYKNIPKLPRELRRATLRIFKHPIKSAQLVFKGLKSGVKNIGKDLSLVKKPITTETLPYLKTTVDRQMNEMGNKLYDKLEKLYTAAKKKLNYRKRYPEVYLDWGYTMHLMVSNDLEREAYSGFDNNLSPAERDARYNTHYYGKDAAKMLEIPPEYGKSYILEILDNENHHVKTYFNYDEMKDIRPNKRKTANVEIDLSPDDTRKQLTEKKMSPMSR